MHKHKEKMFWLLVLFCVLCFNVYIRLYSAWFPQYKYNAQVNVESDIRADIVKKVEKSHDHLNPLIKSKVIKSLLNERLADKSFIDSEIQEKYIELKENYQDDNGQTYLQELDPYHWARYTELVYKNGYPGDRVVNGRSYDDYSLAPKGRFSPKKSFLFYLSANIYHIVRFFISDLDFTVFIFYLPVFYLLLLLLLQYVLVEHFFDRGPAVISVFLMGASAVLVHRSSAGWYDMDVWSLIFPLGILGSILLAFKAKKTLSIILWSSLSAFLTLMFAWTWHGWWFIVVIILFSTLYQIVNNISLIKDDRKKLQEALYPYCISMLSFFLVFTLGYLLMFCDNPYSYVISSIQKAIGIGKSSGVNVWPSTYYTVGELRSGDMLEIFKNLHGGAWFIISIFSMFFIYLKEKRSERSNFVVAMIFWFFFMVYATTKGIRFTLFLTIPVSIVLALGVYDFFVYLFEYKVKLIKGFHRYLVLICIGFLISVTIFTIGRVANANAKSIHPLLNDGWHHVLTQIKDSTEENAIINSWWDYGDWFKAIADRRVIFDGHSQNTPIAYWMARSLYLANEKEAIRILRMLNNESKYLIEDLQKYMGDNYAAAQLLSDLVKTDFENSKDLFDMYNVSPGLRKRIVEAVYYSEPAPAYFVLDSSMFAKTPAISFLGNWNFAKLYVSKNLNQSRETILSVLQRKYSLDRELALQYYNEIVLADSSKEISEVVSSRMTITTKAIVGKQEGQNVYFDDGTVLDLSGSMAKIFHKGKYRNAAFTAIFKDSQLKRAEKLETNSESVFDISKVGALFIHEKDNEWKLLKMSNESLLDSLLVRLYTLDGYQMHYFEPFIIDEDSGVKVYKIKWNIDDEERNEK